MKKMISYSLPSMLELVARKKAQVLPHKRQHALAFRVFQSVGVMGQKGFRFVLWPSGVKQAFKCLTSTGKTSQNQEKGQNGIRE